MNTLFDGELPEPAPRRSAGYALAMALAASCDVRQVTVHETPAHLACGLADRVTATLADGTELGMHVLFEADA
ncbi:MAG TPA: hypothetical protein VGG54_23025 [Trebonia sp.]